MLLFTVSVNVFLSNYPPPFRGSHLNALLPDFEQVYLIFKLGRPMSTALTVLMSNSATHVLDVESGMALDVTQTPTRPATPGTVFNVLICC